jgi:hypothetical protein
MFSLGSGKGTFVDNGTRVQISEVFDLLRLLRAQEQSLDRTMSEEDMRLYETRALQISELLQQVTNG